MPENASTHSEHPCCENEIIRFGRCLCPGIDYLHYTHQEYVWLKTGKLTHPSQVTGILDVWGLDPPSLIINLCGGWYHPRTMVQANTLRQRELQEVLNHARQAVGLLQMREPNLKEPPCKEEEQLLIKTLGEALEARLVDAFVALVDACAQTNSWMILDQAFCFGQQTYLLELALGRTESRPVILVFVDQCAEQFRRSQHPGDQARPEHDEAWDLLSKHARAVTENSGAEHLDVVKLPDALFGKPWDELWPPFETDCKPSMVTDHQWGQWFFRCATHIMIREHLTIEEARKTNDWTGVAKWGSRDRSAMAFPASWLGPVGHVFSQGGFGGGWEPDFLILRAIQRREPAVILKQTGMCSDFYGHVIEIVLDSPGRKGVDEVVKELQHRYPPFASAWHQLFLFVFPFSRISVAMPSGARWKEVDTEDEEQPEDEEEPVIYGTDKKIANDSQVEQQEEDEDEDDEEEEEEEDREELLARLSRVERDRESLREDIQQAQEWADRKEQEWDEKETEFKRLLEAAERRAADAEKRAEELLAARGEELEKERKRNDDAIAANGDAKESSEERLREAEAEASRQKQRAAEAEQLARKAVEAARASEAMRKAEWKEQSQADRCRELQQELENANRELKSLKAQLRQRGDESSSVERQLREAEAEVARLKGSSTSEAPAASASNAAPKTSKKSASAKVADSGGGKADTGANGTAVKQAPAAEEALSTQSATNGKKVKRQQQAVEPAPPPPSEPEAPDSTAASPSSAPTPTAASRATGNKKKATAAPVPSAKEKKQPRQSSRCNFQCTGGHAAAAALVVAVLVQAGLLLNDGLLG